MIIGVPGVITLVDITSTGILGGGTVTDTLISAMVGTSLGTTVVWVIPDCMVLNSFSNLPMACNCLSTIVKVVCGPGFFDYVYQFFVILGGLLYCQ